MWNRDGYDLKRFEPTFLLPRQPPHYAIAKQQRKSDNNRNTETPNEKDSLCTDVNLIKKKMESRFVQAHFCWEAKENVFGKINTLLHFQKISEKIYTCHSNYILNPAELIGGFVGPFSQTCGCFIYSDI